MRRLADRPGLIILAMGIIVALVVIFLLGMDPTIRQVTADRLGYGGEHSDEPGGGRDLFHSGVPIAGAKNGLTYAAYDERRDASPSRAFSGFGCVRSCERQEAGYRWAASQEVVEPRECVGPTWEFVEGCAAFALEPRSK